MKKLIGKLCTCEFDMPSNIWPVPGYPARVEILTIDMPMIEMQGHFEKRPFWINANKISIIREPA